MRTKQCVLLTLLAAAVLLGAALWAVTRSNAKAEQAASVAAEGSIPLSSFAAEDLEQIEYTFNGETYTLQYSGGSWQLAQDPAYHLDESACNTMRTALMALNAKRSLTPQAGEDYGLDSPQLTVTVTAAGQSTTLTFGAENPVTGDLYVQKAGDDAIYTVSGNKAACFQLDKAGLFEVWQIAFWHKPKNFTAINNRCHIIKFSVMVKRKSDYTDDFVRFRLLAVCSQSIFCAFY